MVAKLITERAYLPFANARVNRTAGTISNVLICGTSSANGRDYPAAVLRRDFAKYEGRPVNCDHGREATVDRRFGWFTNVRPGDDGRPRGTLHLLKSHPMYERVMEAAERNPSLYGFSHVAMCRTRPGTSGREVVEAIDHVESIDLVAEPATTRGLFEGKTVQLRKWIEALASKRNNRRLLRVTEEDTGPAMDAPVSDDVPMPGADGIGDADAVGEAIKSAGSAIWSKVCDGSLDITTALGRLKKLAGVLGKAQAALGDDDPDAGGAASESRRRPSGTPPTDAKAFAEWLGSPDGGAPLGAKVFAEAVADAPASAGRPLFTGDGPGLSVSTAFPGRR